MTESIDLTSKPPLHPGYMMSKVLMPQRELDLQTIASKSGIPFATLNEFASENGQMTLEMRNKLRGVFGEAANTLYRMQFSYDYFRTHGRRPPERLLP